MCTDFQPLGGLAGAAANVRVAQNRRLNRAEWVAPREHTHAERFLTANGSRATNLRTIRLLLRLEVVSVCIPTWSRGLRCFFLLAVIEAQGPERTFPIRPLPTDVTL
jgi:hypothetical protein